MIRKKYLIQIFIVGIPASLLTLIIILAFRDYFYHRVRLINDYLITPLQESEVVLEDSDKLSMPFYLRSHTESNVKSKKNWLRVHKNYNADQIYAEVTSNMKIIEERNDIEIYYERNQFAISDDYITSMLVQKLKPEFDPAQFKQEYPCYWIYLNKEKLVLTYTGAEEGLEVVRSFILNNMRKVEKENRI